MSKTFAMLLSTVLDADRTYPIIVWWSCPHANAILKEAVERGWVYRASATQIQWTEAGVEAYQQAMKGGA
jgi:hypothetical protein